VCGAPSAQKHPMSVVPAMLFAASPPGSGRAALIRIHSTTATLANGREIENSWIVSYSIYLLLKYASHINVEVCISVNLVKYVYTYNFKGGDRAMASLGVPVVPGQDGQLAPPWDELADFEYLQSCGTAEACWRFYGFETKCSTPQYKDWICTLRTNTGYCCNEGTRNGV
jgi:hypothetical protein